MRDAFTNTLYELAKKNERIMALVGDVGTIVFDKFRENFPNRFFNMGIAEANMITVAAGLASQGFIPFTYAIAPHITMRPYEQIKNDVCLNNTNVKIVSVGAGLHYSNQGPTHHAIEDFAVLKVLPNMTIFSPCSPFESREVTIAASEITGPVYIRIGRATDTKVEYEFKVGKGVEYTLTIQTQQPKCFFIEISILLLLFSNIFLFSKFERKLPSLSKSISFSFCGNLIFFTLEINWQFL